MGPAVARLFLNIYSGLKSKEVLLFSNGVAPKETMPVKKNFPKTLILSFEQNHIGKVETSGDYQF